MHNLLYSVLKHLPFIHVKESKSFTHEEAARALDRIILERKTQWGYNHPDEEFPGVEESELLKEFERRMWQR